MSTPKPVQIESMHPDCKVAVLVPAYDETPVLVLTLLASLARQAGVNKKEFEVVFIVSNSRGQAKAAAREFKRNQRLIAFIRYLNGAAGRCPVRLSSKYLQAADRIRRSGLVIHVIDRSSVAAAPGFDSANIARDWAGSLICRRFASVPSGGDGVIALTDCDCEFSRNYIAELVSTFAGVGVNRVAGKWLTEIDPSLSHADLLEKAYRIHIGVDNSYKNYRPPKKRLPLIFQNGHGLKKTINVHGQNLAVRASAWIKAGGIGHRYSFDDIIFGHKVSLLPGETVYNPNFWVKSLLRPSERTGIIAQGRRVKVIHDSITEVLAGRSMAVQIPDIRNTVRLGLEIYRMLRQGFLDKNKVRKLLAEHGAAHKNISDAVIAGFIKHLKKDFYRPEAESRLEAFILSKLYDHLPRRRLG